MMMSGIMNIIIGVLFAISISIGNNDVFTAHASNFNKPHSHTGKVEPFIPGDPKVKLDGKAKGILKSGKPYQVSIILWRRRHLHGFCVNVTDFSCHH